jgi:hypothetical protein
MENEIIHLAYSLGPLREGESHLVFDKDMRLALSVATDLPIFNALCSAHLPSRIFSTHECRIVGGTVHHSDGRLLTRTEISCPECVKELRDYLLK